MIDVSRAGIDARYAIGQCRLQGRRERKKDANAFALANAHACVDSHLNMGTLKSEKNLVMSCGTSVIAGYAGVASASSCALLWPSIDKRAYMRAARTHKSTMYVTQAAMMTTSQDGREIGSNSIADLRSR